MTILFYLQRPNLDASGHFEQPIIVPQMTFSAPRLYLANGVTTMRTTGSVEPYTDLSLKREIDAGHLVGPHLDVTGPYLEGPGRVLHPEPPAHFAGGRPAGGRFLGRAGREFVQGIHEYHARRAKSGDRRGAPASASSLPAICARSPIPRPSSSGSTISSMAFSSTRSSIRASSPTNAPTRPATPTLLAMTPGSPDANALIKLLVEHHVAITSTLPVFEQSVPLHAPLQAAPDGCADAAGEGILSVPAQPDREPRRDARGQASRPPTRTTLGSSVSSSPRAGC